MRTNVTARAMAVMARNGGVISRNEARDCGMHDTTIRALIRQGRWVWVRRSVYTDAELWSSLDRAGQGRLRTRAAMKTMRRAHVASHDSAADEHGLEVLRPDPELVHVTRPGVTNAWVEHGVKVHLARFAPDQVVTIGAIPVLDLARTAVDIAREHGSPYGEVACDAAMRKGVTRAELIAAYEIMTCWPYVTRTRAAVDYADPRAESVAETLGRILVDGLGLGDVDLQFPARLRNGRVVWGDIRIGCHFFEVEGRTKLVAVAEGGVATESPTDVAWKQKRRERDLRDVGLGMSQIFYSDFFPPNLVEAEKRLRREYADTVSMFGAQLPERLVREAVELRGRGGRRGA
jgi:hypothetical protein